MAQFIVGDKTVIQENRKEENNISKGYYYKSFDTNITVQKDSSVTVEERQLYSYTGKFNMGYRNIPIKGISNISDVEVVDGETGRLLQYSSKKLDKLDSLNWDKYTYYKKNGEMVIEWYYNLADTDHLWILKYKVYGGVGFYKGHDEIYWNVFTNYDVPIASSTVYINLPANNFLASDFTATAYTSNVGNNPHKWSRDTDQMFEYFTAGPFEPKEMFTVALGWPKGLVDQSAFWKYWFNINWTYFASLLIILGTILYLYFFWLFGEKLKKGRGTIIAEYEPPHNLPPAMAELVVTERNTPASWSATIVDLAVRGYVKIEEVHTELQKMITKTISRVLYIVFIVLVVILSNEGINIGTVTVAIIMCFLIYRLVKKEKDYKILKLKDYNGDSNLHDYEKEFLNILFKGRSSFSTAEMKLASRFEKSELYNEMVKLRKKLFDELSLDESSAYEVSFNKQNIYMFIYFLPFASAFLSFLSFVFIAEFAMYLVPAIVILWSIFTIKIFTKYNPRLSREGRVFKEEWLGFKLYLETAERYRMQNLTPEIFEKFLPYAIIFKVEKKWAKAFDSIVKTEPSWYGRTDVTSPSRSMLAAGVVSGGVTGFSASAFSSSFSSSLSSAFASSGASGGSGGGGGAGGGGGGGGGGAS